MPTLSNRFVIGRVVPAIAAAAVGALAVSAQTRAASVDYSSAGGSAITASGSLLAASVDESSATSGSASLSAGGPASLTGGGTTHASTTGVKGDNIPDFVYDASTGDVKLDPDGFGAGIDNFVFNSASGIFKGTTPVFPGSSFFTTDTDNQVSQTFFAPPIGASAWDFGNIALPNLDQATLNQDLTNTFLRSSTNTTPSPLDVIVVNAVPEPASIGLLGLGAVGMLIRRRRA